MKTMKLEVNLENCHGIRKMRAHFDYAGAKHAIVIHAPNGTMKSSFCKTVKDILENRETHDELDLRKKVIRDIRFGGKPVSSDNTVVFDSDLCDEARFTSNIGNALINPALREELWNAQDSFRQKTDDFLRNFSEMLGVKFDKANDLLLSFFKENSQEINAQLVRIETALSRKKKFIDRELKFSSLFSNPMETLAKKPEFQKSIKDYSRCYERLMKKSSIFTRGIFDLHNLREVANSFKTNRFFEGHNICRLNGIDKDITSGEELERIINGELKKISTNPELQKSFSNVDSLCQEKPTTQKVAPLLQENIDYCRGFADYDVLKRNYLYSALHEVQAQLHEVNAAYDKALGTIRCLLAKASKEKGVWQGVIKEFNERFCMPYTLRIHNTKNAVLGLDGLFVSFDYGEAQNIEFNTLEAKVLSNGEKRALRVLDILFQIAELNKTDASHLLIFDDIADSFDYTNKHALLEYLNELSENKNCYLLVLTHNFDFYRSVGNRIAGYKQSFFALKTDSQEILIESGKYLKNFFQDGVLKEIKGKKAGLAVVSCVPAARAIIEFTAEEYSEDPRYLFFTRLLHYRPKGSSNIRVNAVLEMVSKTLNTKLKSPFRDNPSFYGCVMRFAADCSKETSVTQNISEKIVLALALRIRGERYMYSRLLKKKEVRQDDYCKMEFGEVFGKFKEAFPKDRSLKTLESIKLITPEEMHFNAFMYEPLIDFSVSRLRSLFLELNKYQHNFGNVEFQRI